jgi:hypothetical protein
LVPAEYLQPDQRRAVVLHIGMGKTGTTSLQAWLHRNRERLAGHEVLYPASPGQRRHVRLGLAMQRVDREPGTSVDWRRQQVSTPRELRPLFEQALLAELSDAPSRLLFSDEALFTASDEGLRYLRVLLAKIAASVRVVVYLRRQDEHLCSRYQQTIKLAGEVRRLTEWLGDHDFSRKYDYHARLRRWQTLVSPDPMVVRVFERGRLADGSLHSDFLEATGLGISPEDLDPVPDRNQSLDAESVEFLRLFNVLRQDHPDTTAGLPRHSRIVNRLLRASDGPVLTLPDNRLEQFMARYEESNRAVARDFVSDVPESLFSSNRKSRQTTTEQRLDPVRLDYFINLCELPEQTHAPLRELVEREARAG